MRVHRLQILGLVAVEILLAGAQVETTKQYFEFCYGENEELLNNHGEFETHEAAFESYVLDHDPEPGTTIYVSKLAPYQPSISADQIIESLGEDAYSECGESQAENYPDCTETEKGVLQILIDVAVSDWLERIGAKQLKRCYDSKEFVVEERKEAV
jgi:hypothetical protein